MEDPGRTLVVKDVQAMAYQARTKGKRAGVTNFLVKLRGEARETLGVVGVGECQPRLGATGDRAGESWKFLTACLSRLAHREFPVTDEAAALAAVRAAMREFHGMTAEFGGDVNWREPFRGTLAGIEMALLDLLARALELPLHRLLAGEATTVPAQAAPVSSRADADALREVLTGQAGFSSTRLQGTGNVAANLGRLEAAAGINASDAVGQPDKPLWLRLGGRLSRDDADALVLAIAERIRAGTLPPEVLIEHPVAAANRYHLPLLQHKADRATARSGRDGADIRIVADHASWNARTMGRRAQLVSGIGRLGRIRGPRAAYLKPAQVGGLLETVAAAARIRAGRPGRSGKSGTRIYLGGMDGGTEITAAALRNLAMAIPELDSLADDRLAAAPELSAPAEPGIGVRETYDEIIGDVTEFFAVPEPPVSTHEGMTANVYPEVTYLQPLGSNGTKGHLLEREALMLGLSTKRYSKGAFVASDGVNAGLSFKWSRSPLSSAVSLALCTHKEATRMRLRRAGVPVPKGCTFAEGDYQAARAFVERIGYPVVVKPAMGVRGIGVAANIRDDEALEQAFKQLEASSLGHDDFIVEQHVNGRDYRIVVIGDEVAGAILREPGSVTGDGKSSIAELVIAKNVARRGNPHLWGRPIKYDEAARFQLSRAGRTLDTVPAAGEKVLLSGSCSLSQGGDSIDVLDELHPTIKDAAIRAVKAVPGLAFCGVDFLLEDHAQPLDGQEAGICELNAHAAIGNCEYPLYGTPRAVARTLMAECVTQFGLNTTQRQGQLALHLTVRGRVTAVGYRAWLRRWAKEFGLTGWVRNVSERVVEAVIIGDAEPASALAALAVLGPKAAAPTDVTTTHIEASPLASFDVVTEAPKEYANAR